MIQSSCGRCGTTKCKFVSNTSGKMKGRKGKLIGKGPIGSLLGNLAGSISGSYFGPGGLAVGSQLGANLGDLLPF